MPKTTSRRVAPVGGAERRLRHSTLDGMDTTETATGRTIVIAGWAQSALSDWSTTITDHAVRRIHPTMIAACGAPLAEVDHSRPWDPEGEDVCPSCAEQAG